VGEVIVPPSSSATRSLQRDLLLIVGLMLCGAVLLFGVMLFAIYRAVRPRRARPAAVPIYAPPPAVQAQWQPTAPPQLAGPQPPGAWGQLSVISGPSLARAYPLGGSGALIGRGEDCAVMLIGDGTVSRRHALIRYDGRQVTVEDSGSTHGTYLAGQRITWAVPIRRGDVIQVGQTLLRFE
jgi:hypothetical protein